MSETAVGDVERHRPDGGLAATLSVVAGVVSIAVAVFEDVTLYRDLGSPTSFSAAGLIALPISLVVTAVLALIGWRGAGHGRAVVGAALGVIGVLASVPVLVLIVGILVFAGVMMLIGT